MHGPFKPGTLQAYRTTTSWERSLRRGRCYRVVRDFSDGDGAFHAVGEQWHFVGSAFNHYDNEHLIYVVFPDGYEWRVPLLLSDDYQRRIYDRIADYIEPVLGIDRPELFDGAICSECHHQLSWDRPEYCPTCGEVWNLVH